MKHSLIILTLLLTITIANNHKSINSLLTYLQHDYDHSHYALHFNEGSDPRNPHYVRYAFWWKVLNNGRDVAFTAIGLTEGFLGVGFSPLFEPGKEMVGSIAVIGRHFANGTELVEERHLVKRDINFIELVPPQNIYNTSCYELDGYSVSEFVWNISRPNQFYNFTADGDTHMVYSMGKDQGVLQYHHHHRNYSTIQLSTGDGATPFLPCTSYCLNGECYSQITFDTDYFVCTCEDGWEGFKCDTVAPPPKPPTPPDNGPGDVSSYKSNYTINMISEFDGSAILYWNYSDTQLDLALQVIDLDIDEQYIAFGVPKQDSKEGLWMFDTDAVIAHVEKDGSLKVGTYTLETRRPESAAVETKNYVIENVVAAYNNSVFTLKFSRAYDTGNNHLDPENENYVLVAIGLLNKDGNFGHHKYRSLFYNGYPDAINFKFSNSTHPNGTFTFDKRHVHGLLMYSAWGIMLPFGGLIARHLRSPGSNSTTWFNLHRVMQMIGSILALSGFGVIIAYVQEFELGHFSSAHPIGGLILIICLVLQVAFAILRPHISPNTDKTQKRKIWEIQHHFTAYTILLGALGVMAFGLNLLLQNDSILMDGAQYYYYGYAGLLVVIVIVLEIRRYFTRKHNGYDEY
eukprot:TRINITY_DN9325_c0_g1_i1.p1 TRINITY_DN9325_c0_g1~~TRINITY_DN9325_c0_g1_i1.p1  ORF type:complete len:629 (-),score=122.42 TRINITY_DN9325_c0_g1_i1:11-1897(-)